MPKGLVIGLGHPRSGTTSLYSLLDMQQFLTVTHETHIRLPWIKCPSYMEYNITRVLEYPSAFVGDVAFYYLNYVKDILKYYPYTKFVCMKRDKEDTINSLQKFHDIFKTNHLVDRTSPHWDPDWIINSEESAMYRPCFPKYNLAPEDALSKFYDEYYERVAELQRTIQPGQFQVFDMNKTMNTEDGQGELLEGYLRLLHPIYSVGIRVFKGTEPGAINEQNILNTGRL